MLEKLKPNIFFFKSGSLDDRTNPIKNPKNHPKGAKMYRPSTSHEGKIASPDENINRLVPTQAMRGSL